MAFKIPRLPFRRRVPEPPAAQPQPPPPPPERPFPVRLLGAAWGFVLDAFSALDEAFCWFAVPFGVHVADPVRRYAILFGVFVAIYVLGSLPAAYVPLFALGAGYLGVLAIGRAWVRNEKTRTAIMKKLQDGDPDRLPDLRWTALVAALQLFILFPLLFHQVERHFGLYRLDEPVSFWGWMWFSIDKTYLKALPDWSMLYGVHISSIEFDRPWGRHLVLLTRLTFDYILIQGIVRLLAIRATTAEAVAAVKADPSMAVRLGKRAIPALVDRLSDPDREVRGAAANALMQLGDPDAIRRISNTAEQ